MKEVLKLREMAEALNNMADMMEGKMPEEPEIDEEAPEIQEEDNENLNEDMEYGNAKHGNENMFADSEEQPDDKKAKKAVLIKILAAKMNKKKPMGL